MGPKIAEILDDCLSELKKGSKIDACLKKYPEQADEIRPLLETISELQVSMGIEPSEQFIHSAKERILQKAAEKVVLPVRQPLAETNAPVWQSWRRSSSAIRLLRIAAVCLIGLLFASSAISASADTLPGDLLYPVKRTVEEASMLMAFSDKDRVGLQLELAQRRLAESNKVFKAGDLEAAGDLLQEMGDNLARARDISASLDNRQELLKKMITLSERQQATLWKVYEKVPEQAKEAIGQAIDRSKRGHEQAVQALQDPEENRGDRHDESEDKGRSEMNGSKKETDNEEGTEERIPGRPSGSGQENNQEQDE